MTAPGENVSAAGLDRLRWQLLRWGPRADSGVLLAEEPADDGTGRVDVITIGVALPIMAWTGDFAPVDMQYRMHRELLWSEESGLWGQTAEVDAAGDAVGDPPIAGEEATLVVADALETALRIGGDAVPAEMRGRWQRQAAELRGLLAA